MSKELVDWAKLLSDNRKVPFADVLKAVEEALAVSCRRKYDGERVFRVELNPKTGEQTIYRQWKVVEEVMYPTREISIEAALLEDPNIKVGDHLEDLEENESIKQDRNSFITFRQMIMSSMKVLEKRRIIQSYVPYIGQMVIGKVRRQTNNHIAVTLPEMDVEEVITSPDEYDEDLLMQVRSTDGIIRKDGLIQGERYRVNQSIRALLVSINEDKDGEMHIVLSRSHPDIIKQLMRREIPEIRDGVIEIVDIAREGGRRAKVVVRSDRTDLDVVGACVGVRSSRIEAISRELNNERIDIIQYEEDLANYVWECLCRPNIERIVIDERRNVIEVFVSPDSLSNAIGRQGVNVRLASKLVGIPVRVYSIEEFANLKEQQFAKNLEEFENTLGLDRESAEYLIDQGFTTIEELAGAEQEELEEILDPEQAQMLRQLAQDKLNSQLNAQVEYIEQANVEDALLDLEGMSSEIIIELIKKDIKTLEALADLATDELTDCMAPKLAESLIMQARQICWFNNAEEEASL